MACLLGGNPPHPAPCKILKNTSMPRLGARPHKSELTVNAEQQDMKNRLHPIKLENHPDNGSTMAFDTRYDVSTQVDSSEPADKPPAMCGSATLAIDVSNTSINVASVTVTAITQGLIEPSGIRSFDRILFSISRYSAIFPLLYASALLLFDSPFYSAITVASTFIPGRKIAFS